MIGNNSEFLEADDKLSKTEIYLMAMEYIQSVEYFICFLANILTISAVIRFDYLHKKSTNILILSLSMADGLLGREFSKLLSFCRSLNEYLSRI